jgi:hypothetical protein
MYTMKSNIFEGIGDDAASPSTSQQKPKDRPESEQRSLAPNGESDLSD